MKKALFIAYVAALFALFVPLVYTQPDASNGIPRWWPRLLFTSLGLALWYATQYWIGEKKTHDASQERDSGVFLTRTDLVLAWTQPAHDWLHAHSRWANALLISSSCLVDALGMFLLVGGIFGPSIRPCLGLLIVFALRQVFQGLITLPPPPTMIWRDPGFPSILVTYGVANDLFFSGHTALATYGVIELIGLGPAWMVIGLLVAVYEIVTVLLVRAHYTMDVYAGFATALATAPIVDRIAPYVDQFLCRVFTP